MRTDIINTPLEVIILIQEKHIPKQFPAVVAALIPLLLLSFKFNKLPFSPPLEELSWRSSLCCTGFTLAKFGSINLKIK